MAEGVGFEPTVGCPTHAFQACRFGRSRIPPGVPRAQRAEQRAQAILSARPASRMWRSGPVQRRPVNRVRAGRQQLSAESAVCRRSPGRHLRWRALAFVAPRRRYGSPVESPAMAYQSLYRRYRPQRFAEVRGQDHVVTALRNAVREDRVGHAYLFSGPRGHGQDVDGPHPRQGPQLREPGRRRAVRRVRVVPRRSRPAPASTSTSSTPRRTTASRPCATSSTRPRSARRAARRCTSSTRSTCSRRRRRTRC